MKTTIQDRYTSTGAKFWRHFEQMKNYQWGHLSKGTVISTHIAPTARCNLRCPYCSVIKRNQLHEIDFRVAADYVEQILPLGLKAVILTGGGEPTLYPEFDRLVAFLADKKLSVGLITNGTKLSQICETTLKVFKWVRVSINIFPRVIDRLAFDRKTLNDAAVLGCSFIVDKDTTIDDFDIASKVARNMKASYIRTAPNCTHDRETRQALHDKIDFMVKELGEPLFFHQQKDHGHPQVKVCHQAYFRPYLSEVPDKWTGVCGTVFPCDSLVLNAEGGLGEFTPDFQLCPASHIGKFLRGEMPFPFMPKEKCPGCIFCETVNMLEGWKNRQLDRFMQHHAAIEHEEFV